MERFIFFQIFSPRRVTEPGKLVEKDGLAAANNLSSFQEIVDRATFCTVKAVPGRRRIIATSVEHATVMEVCREMACDGCEVTFLGVDRHGNLDLDEYVQALRGDTLLVTIMHANNETGVVFPVECLARLSSQSRPRRLSK